MHYVSSNDARSQNRRSGGGGETSTSHVYRYAPHTDQSMLMLACSVTLRTNRKNTVNGLPALYTIHMYSLQITMPYKLTKHVRNIFKSHNVMISFFLANYIDANLIQVS